jgi:T-complex protein 1 subunit theta
MALHVPRAPGFASMMKDGARFYSGLEEAVFRYGYKEFFTKYI